MDAANVCKCVAGFLCPDEHSSSKSRYVGFSYQILDVSSFFLRKKYGTITFHPNIWSVMMYTTSRKLCLSWSDGYIVLSLVVDSTQTQNALLVSCNASVVTFKLFLSIKTYSSLHAPPSQPITVINHCLCVACLWPTCFVWYHWQTNKLR